MGLRGQQIQGFFDIPVDHLYAAPVMYEYLKTKKLRDLVVVSPDVGGLKMALCLFPGPGCGPWPRGQTAQERYRGRVAGR